MATPAPCVAEGCEADLLLRHLPVGWELGAKPLGALVRRGVIRDPATLLRLLLRHVADNDSLRRTTALTAAEGGPALSPVGLHKRLAHSGDWLESVVTAMCARSVTPLAGFGRRVVIADATVVTAPGSTGTDWRIHTLLNLGDLTLAAVLVTDAQGGERLDHFPLRRGDLVLADRGYAHPASVAYARDCGADVLIRWKTGFSGLRAADGAPFDLRARLARLSPRCHLVDWPTAVRSKQGRLFPGRLIAWRTAKGWLLLWTTLAKSTQSARRLVDCYRGRWQVELSYKRHKSLLGGDGLRKVTPATARAWLWAKVLLHQLVEAEVALLRQTAASLPPAAPAPACAAPTTQPVGLDRRRPTARARPVALAAAGVAPT